VVWVDLAQTESAGPTATTIGCCSACR
jgi:hypothetical protein